MVDLTRLRNARAACIDAPPVCWGCTENMSWCIYNCFYGKPLPDDGERGIVRQSNDDAD